MRAEESAHGVTTGSIVGDVNSRLRKGADKVL